METNATAQLANATDNIDSNAVGTAMDDGLGDDDATIQS